jgi:hypothetical protein
MNVFSLKSLGLYSLVIAGAIGFFQIVTSYGEANIKAPMSVVGNYLITAPNLPNCLQNKQLLLKLQQSGIYLNASLIDRSQVTTMNKDNHPTLSGRLNSQKVNLTGLLSTTLCDRLSPIHITGSFANLPNQIVDRQTTKVAKILAQQPPQLQGQLTIDNPDGRQSSPFNFTGMIQPVDRLPLGAATPPKASH